MILRILLCVIISYLLGCCHPAYFFGKTKNKLDIRDHGTNNSGTSNAVIVLGFKYGVMTFVIDFLKGTAAVLITRYLIYDSPVFIYTACAFVFLGHLFPFYLKFRGGKGLAVTLGASLGLEPLLCLALVVALIAASVITQYLVAGTVTVSVLFAVYTGYVYGLFSFPFAFALIICVLMLYMHKANYKKIRNRTEPRLFDVLGINKARNKDDNTEQ